MPFVCSEALTQPFQSKLLTPGHCGTADGVWGERNGAHFRWNHSKCKQWFWCLIQILLTHLDKGDPGLITAASVTIMSRARGTWHFALFHEENFLLLSLQEVIQPIFLVHYTTDLLDDRYLNTWFARSKSIYSIKFLTAVSQRVYLQSKMTTIRKWMGNRQKYENFLCVQFTNQPQCRKIVNSNEGVTL